MSGRDRLKTYKNCGKTDENRRRERASKLQIQRNASRGNNLARRRGMEEEPQEQPQQVVQVCDPVRVKLDEWKKKREEKLRKEKVALRPAFKVGAVRHDDTPLYRPAGESKKFKPPQNLKPMSVQRPVTRILRSGNRYVHASPKPNTPTVAQAVHEFAAALKPIREEEFESELNLTFDKDSENIGSIIAENDNVQVSELNSTYPKNDVEAMNIAGDVVEPTATNIETDTDVLKETPAVTKTPLLEKSEICEGTSKSNLVADIPESLSGETTKECTNAVTQGATETMEQQDAPYFKSLHAATVATLEQFCEKWMELKEQGLPTHIEDQVDVAVGYARLFIKEKLQQFAELIEDHLNENTQPPVLIEDLAGFWSLVDIPVQDLHKKFANLDALRENNWKEPKPEPQMKAVRGRAKKKAPAGKATSNARAFIELARKQMKPHCVSSPKPMSPAVMRVSLMAKNIAVTPPKRDSPVPVTPLSKNRPRSKKPEKENVQPSSSFSEIGQCLKPSETPARDPAVIKAVQMAAGGGGKTPVLTPRRSRKVLETPNSAVRRSLRILNKGNDRTSDLISWNTPS